MKAAFLYSNTMQLLVLEIWYIYLDLPIADILVVGDIQSILIVPHTTLKLVHRLLEVIINCYSTIVYQTYSIDKHYYRTPPLSMSISFDVFTCCLHWWYIHTFKNRYEMICAHQRYVMIFSGCAVYCLTANQHNWYPHNSYLIHPLWLQMSQKRIMTSRRSPDYEERSVSCWSYEFGHLFKKAICL